MAITINNGIANIDGTPGAASGVFSNRPSASNVANGTLYFATDTAAIYQVVAGLWVNYAGGGGGGSSTGINGLNGTTNIGLGGTLLNATAINADSFAIEFNTVKTFNIIDDAATTTNFEFGNSAIKTFYNNEQIGLKLDFLSDTFIFGRLTNDFNTRTYLRSTPNVIEMGASEAYVLGNDIAQLYGAINTIIKTNQILTTRNGNDDITGLSFDVQNYNYKIGDLQFDNYIEFNNIVTGNVVLNVQNYFTTKNAGVELGLKLDFTNNQYFFGGNPGVNGSTFVVDNFNGFIFIKDPTGSTNVFNFDMVGQVYEFGDIIGNNSISINSGAGNLLIKSQNNITLYRGSSGLNLQNGISILCDPDGNGNSSFFGLDDNAEKLIGSTNLLATTGTPTSDRIKIELNGTLYYIVLEK